MRSTTSARPPATVRGGSMRSPTRSRRRPPSSEGRRLVMARWLATAQSTRSTSPCSCTRSLARVRTRASSCLARSLDASIRARPSAARLRSTNAETGSSQTSTSSNCQLTTALLAIFRPHHRQCQSQHRLLRCLRWRHASARASAWTSRPHSCCTTTSAVWVPTRAHRCPCRCDS